MAEPALPSREALERFNQLEETEARAALTRCCGSSRWVAAMLQARPFPSVRSLFAEADALWSRLEARDYLEAFAEHPEIGADAAELARRFAETADLSRAEQAGAADASPATSLALGELNRAYRARFGYGFIVCATGKSAAEMLALLQKRLAGAPELELELAAAEQAKITRLRLEKL